MISRSFQIFSLVCSAVLLLAAKDAYAGSPDGGAIAVPSDFDLSDRPAERRTISRYRLGGEDDRAQFKKDKLGPRWSFSPMSGGPTLEFAALGAGRKGAPRLAHVGVDWSF